MTDDTPKTNILKFKLKKPDDGYVASEDEDQAPTDGNYITEIIPDLDKMPGWAREAFLAGQFFAVAFKRVAGLEETINKAKADPNAEQTSDDPSVDNSYTGQIAQLRRKLGKVRAALTKHKCSSVCTKPVDGPVSANEIEKMGVPCLHCALKAILESK